MLDDPKRSGRDTIIQLIVIAILIAILIGALLFLRQYIDAHNASSLPGTSFQMSRHAQSVGHEFQYRELKSTI